MFLNHSAWFSLFPEYQPLLSYVISQYIVSAQKFPSAVCFLHIKLLPLSLHEGNVINKPKPESPRVGINIGLVQ